MNVGNKGFSSFLILGVLGLILAAGAVYFGASALKNILQPVKQLEQSTAVSQASQETELMPIDTPKPAKTTVPKYQLIQKESNLTDEQIEILKTVNQNDNTF